MSNLENNPDKQAKVFADDRANVFHSWSAQAQISPMVVAGGGGSYFWDFTGKKYLDFSCQLVFTNIGHQHPKVIAAIKAQADVLATVAPQHANEARNQAAKAIIEVANGNFQKVFFTNAGADGVENAVRMARLHTNKHKILSTYRSYHGNTGSAINATGDPRRFPNEFAFGHVHFWGPYLYRSAFWATNEAEECQRALEHLEQTIIFEGPKTIAAVLIESGWVPKDTSIDEFENAIRSVCEPIFNKPLKEISFGRLLIRLFQTSRRFNMEIQPQLTMLQKTLLNVEGLGRNLDPDLDLWKTAAPFLKKYMSEQKGIKHILKSLKNELPHWLHLTPQLPRLIHELLEQKKHENENAIHQEDIDRLLKTQKNQSRWFKIVITLIGITLLVNLTVLFYFVK